MAREAPCLTLTPLTPSDVHRLAAEILGAVPSAELVRDVMTATRRPAVPGPSRSWPRWCRRTACPRRTPPRCALIERLRRVDEPVLDTLLLSSLSPDLGPDDVAAALGVDRGEAQQLVDRREGQRPHRPVAQPGVHCVAASRASPRSSAPRGITRSKHALAPHATREVHAVNRSGAATGRARAARPSAGGGADRSRRASTRTSPASAARLYRAATKVGADARSTRGSPTRWR